MRVAGYVKLARMWEKRRADALAYHEAYYKGKYKDSPDAELVGVYVDITGEKQMIKRHGMLRLLGDCRRGKVECIAVQTKAYLAADTREFCYLLKTLSGFNGGIDIVTEDVDYHIDTARNPENQKEALLEMADRYIALNPQDFSAWHGRLLQAIEKEEE